MAVRRLCRGAAPGVDLTRLARALDWPPLPAPGSPAPGRVGGPGCAAARACSRRPLVVPGPGPRSRARSLVFSRPWAPLFSPLPFRASAVYCGGGVCFFVLLVGYVDLPTDLSGGLKVSVVLFGRPSFLLSREWGVSVLASLWVISSGLIFASPLFGPIIWIALRRLS